MTASDGYQALREHEARVEEIERAYRWKLLDLDEQMRALTRQRNADRQASWEIYLDSQGKKNCVCEGDTLCAYHARKSTVVDTDTNVKDR